MIGLTEAHRASTPVALRPMTAYASQLTGMHAPCNLSTGRTAAGKPCVDDTAAINRFLMSASKDAPIQLIQDLGSSVTGIQLPASGHVTISCLGWDTGFFIAAGSDAHVVRDVPSINGYGTGIPGTPGENVMISNCRINGNRGNGIDGDSNSGNPREAANGHWLMGIYLDNQTHVRLFNNWVYNAPAFGIVCNACSDVLFDGNRLDAASHALNQDGIHLDGPSRDIRIVNNWCNTSDDCIAANASEGYGGSIDGVVVANSHCLDCLTAYRQLSNETGLMTNPAVRNVVISNYSGTITSSHGIRAVVMRLGENSEGQKATDIMKDVSASNLHFSSASPDAFMIEILDNLGTLDVSGLTWESPAGANALLSFRTKATVSSISLRGIHIARNPSGSAAAYLVNVAAGDIIDTLHLEGVYVENSHGHSYDPIPDLLTVSSGGAVSKLDIGSVDPSNITALASSGNLQRIGRIYGAGLAATGFQIPDDIIPDHVPYVSRSKPNVGKLCFKRNGIPVCM